MGYGYPRNLLTLAPLQQFPKLADNGMAIWANSSAWKCSKRSPTSAIRLRSLGKEEATAHSNVSSGILTDGRDQLTCIDCIFINKWLTSFPKSSGHYSIHEEL